MHVPVAVDRLPQAGLSGRIDLAVDALDHQLGAVAGGKRTLERIDHPKRVLSLEHAAVVEGEQKDETLRKTELGARARDDRRHLDRNRNLGHRDRGYRRDRLGHVLGGHPYLVQDVERRLPLVAKARHFPEPQTDRTAPEEELLAHLFGELGQHVGVHTDEVDRKTGVRRREMGEGMPLPAGRNARAVDRDQRNLDGVERPYHLPGRLADPQLRAKVADHVYPQGLLALGARGGGLALGGLAFALGIELCQPGEQGHLLGADSAGPGQQPLAVGAF